MKVTHLNCGTLCPMGAHFFGDADSRGWQRGRLVCHCLLVELPDGLVLVDTGLSTADVDRRHGWRHTLHLKTAVWAALDELEPAARQLRRLGYDPRDVRDIVLTHLDLDHAGGLVLVDQQAAYSLHYRPLGWKRLTKKPLHDCLSGDINVAVEERRVLLPHGVEQPVAEVGDELRKRNYLVRLRIFVGGRRVGFYTVKHGSLLDEIAESTPLREGDSPQG